MLSLVCSLFASRMLLEADAGLRGGGVMGVGAMGGCYLMFYAWWRRHSPCASPRFPLGFHLSFPRQHVNTRSAGKTFHPRSPVFSLSSPFIHVDLLSAFRAPVFSRIRPIAYLQISRRSQTRDPSRLPPRVVPSVPLGSLPVPQPVSTSRISRPTSLGIAKVP